MTASHTDHTHQTRLAAASGWIGSALEYYDFFIYATAAALIFPQIFFPSSNPQVAIVASLATYGVGYVARPIGALVLGSASAHALRALSGALPWPSLMLGVAALAAAGGAHALLRDQLGAIGLEFFELSPVARLRGAQHFVAGAGDCLIAFEEFEIWRHVGSTGSGLLYARTKARASVRPDMGGERVSCGAARLRASGSISAQAPRSSPSRRIASA